ncbi:MAG: DUF983 domain-containing protein [Isosphaeraceae bacterium]
MARSRNGGTFRAIVSRRCPRCGEGEIFGALFTMNETCSVCGLKFGRGEPGYFTGAMYVSYALAIPIIALLTLIEFLLLPKLSILKLVFLAWALSIPLIPRIWQYSRVLWIHFDQAIDPENHL